MKARLIYDDVRMWTIERPEDFGDYPDLQAEMIESSVEIPDDLANELLAAWEAYRAIAGKVRAWSIAQQEKGSP